MLKTSLSFIVVSFVAIFSLLVNVIIWPTTASKQTASSSSFTQSLNDENDGRTINMPGTEWPTIETKTTMKDHGVFNSTLTSDLQQYWEEKNYKALVDKLTDLGIPKSVISALVLSGIESTEKNLDQSPYWKQQSFSRVESVKNRLLASAKKREQLLSLFGDEIKDDPDFYSVMRPYQNSLGFLSSEKQIALYELQLQQISANQHVSPSTQQQLLKEILGNKDYYEYLLRESATAKILKQELLAFNYAEHDYRELFRIAYESENQTEAHKGIAFQSANLSSRDFGLRGQQREENRIKQEKIKNYLGEERYQEYQRAKQPDFRQVQAISQKQNVQQNDTLRIFEIIVKAKKKLAALNKNLSVTFDEKERQREAIFSELKEELSDVVSEQSATIYISELLSKNSLHAYH